MNEFSPRRQGAFTSLVCSILALVGVGVIFIGGHICPDFFFSHQKGTEGWPAFPLLLLIVLTAVFWFSGLLGGSVALAGLRRGRQAYCPDRTRRTARACTAVALGLMPPALALWFVSVPVGLMMLLFYCWRRRSRAQTRAEAILQRNTGELELDKRLQEEPSNESDIHEPKAGLAQVGPLTVVALAIAVLIPLALFVIVKSAPGGHLNYEILLAAPAYFICVGLDAALLFVAIRLDRKSGRASLPVASVVVIVLLLAVVGIVFLW
jgi:Ca2+/H+ antiporter